MSALAWIGFVLLAGIALVFLWHGFEAALAWLALVLKSEDRLGLSRDGYVVLQGRTLPLPGVNLRAPLTGQPCLGWEYRLERKAVEVGETVRSPVHRLCLPFRLRDSLGECWVFLPTSLSMQIDDKWEGDEQWPSATSRADFRARKWDAPRLPWKYRQRHTPAEQPATVLGWLKIVDGAHDDDFRLGMQEAQQALESAAERHRGTPMERQLREQAEAFPELWKGARPRYLLFPCHKGRTSGVYAGDRRAARSEARSRCLIHLVLAGAFAAFAIWLLA